MRPAGPVLAVLLLLGGCAGASDDPPAGAGGPAGAVTSPAAQPGDAAADDLYPDVLEATATRSADGTWQVTATLSSPYDSPEQYADAWRALAPDGTVLGVRELAHDHAGEQPFTRSLGGVTIPEGTESVIVEGRDQVNGWGGATVEVPLGS